jgi:hypothetical protein
LDGKTILIEKDLKDDVSRLGQHNFTVGHETAHQILSLLYPGDYTVKVRKERLLYYRAESEKRGPVRDWEEWQANALLRQFFFRQIWYHAVCIVWPS